MITKHYVNLTQGLKAVLQYDLKDYYYIVFINRR